MQYKIAKLLFLLLLALALATCDCEDLSPATVDFLPPRFTVEFDEPDSVPDDRRFCVLYFFSREPDPTTFRANETVFARDAEIESVEDADLGRIQVCVIVPDGCARGQPCGREFTVVMDPESAAGPRSQDDVLLDGDYDYTPGGNFVRTYAY